MKIKKKAASSLYAKAGKVSSSKGNIDDSVASWAVTDTSKFSKLAKEAKFENRNAPELWVGDGQSRIVRFLDEDPIVAFKVYKVKVNGKWRTFVKPPDGQVDKLATAGLKATTVFVFRVIDIDGYTNKQGKKVTNKPCFFVVGTRVFEQIKMLKIETEDEGGLTARNVKISRTGTSTSTAYMFMPKTPGSMTPEQKKAAAEFPKWSDYYKPASVAQQDSVLASMGVSAEDEDEE